MDESFFAIVTKNLSYKFVIREYRPIPVGRAAVHGPIKILRVDLVGREDARTANVLRVGRVVVIEVEWHDQLRDLG